MMDTMHEIPSDSHDRHLHRLQRRNRGKVRGAGISRQYGCPASLFTGRSKKDRTGEIA